jgi:hypothetical protein
MLDDHEAAKSFTCLHQNSQATDRRKRFTKSQVTDGQKKEFHKLQRILELMEQKTLSQVPSR